MGKFDTLLSRSGIVGEKQKMNYFVKGLPDLYQKAIIVSGTTTYTAAKQKVRDIKMGRDRLGIDQGEKDPNAMDVDRSRINAVKAGPGDECFYCQKKGHWAKDCQKKQFDGGNAGPSTNGMTFVQRGRGRSRGRGQRRGRGQSRGGFRGRGRGGKYIWALEGEDELPN